MKVKEFLLRKGMSSSMFYSWLLVAGFVVLAVALWFEHLDRNSQAATWTQETVSARIPEFETVAKMYGVVVKNEGSNILGYHWVTFQREDNKVNVTGLSREPIRLGERVCLKETTVSIFPEAVPTRIDIVLPAPRRR